MVEFDLVIRGGTVIDGSGAPRYSADLGVRGNRIESIGVVRGKGKCEVNAEGHIVTPGFIDGHTHMDAQMFWDPHGTSSCWHGVTTAVLGNCGFTLAPSRRDERSLVIDNLVRAEDIPAEALAAGLEFRWETFGEYMDVLDSLPKGINVATYIGHSALRTYAMGHSAFSDVASQADLEMMKCELWDALSAGAVGLSTSRSDHHLTPAGKPVASRVAAWEEVDFLVEVLAEFGAGVFELSNETIMTSSDAGLRAEAMFRLKQLAIKHRVPTTFGVTTYGDPNRWRDLLSMMDEAALEGAQMWGQSSCQPSGAVYNFETWLPFDKIPEWRDFRKLPLSEQKLLIGNKDVRRRLVEAVHDDNFALGKETVSSSIFERLIVMAEAGKYSDSIATIANARGTHPVEAMLDLMIESDFRVLFFQATSNDVFDDVRAILEHPRTVMTFSDAGAHVSQIINASLPTHLLSVWVRERKVFTLEHAISMLTLTPAQIWGFSDRGLLRKGYVADINIIDPELISERIPEVRHDLPAGAVRLTQEAVGYQTTIVNGQVVLEGGVPTGNLPGVLLRAGRPH